MNKKINSFIKRLKEKKLTLALAESMTCGLAAHMLSTVPGTAEVLKGSLVCYTPEVKTGVLKVPKKLIDRFTAESMEVTEALARNLSKIMKADIYAAITGLASSDGSETKNKPVGTVFFCILYRKNISKERKVFNGTPLEVREKACLNLYSHIIKMIK